VLAEFRAKVDDGQVKEHPLDGVVVLLLLLRQFLLRGLSQGRRRLVLKRYGGGVTILGVLVSFVVALLLLLREFLLRGWSLGGVGPGRGLRGGGRRGWCEEWARRG